METVKWAEWCNRYAALYNGHEIALETAAAWYEAWGFAAAYPTAMRALQRCAEESDRRPGLATLRQAYRDLDSTARARGRAATEVESATAAARRAALMRDWRTIHAARSRYPAIAAMFRTLYAQHGGADATDEQASLVRSALLDEIKHLMPDDLAPPPVVYEDGDPGPVEPPMRGSVLDDVDPFATPAQRR